MSRTEWAVAFDEPNYFASYAPQDRHKYKGKIYETYVNIKCYSCSTLHKVPTSVTTEQLDAMSQEERAGRAKRDFGSSGDHRSSAVKMIERKCPLTCPLRQVCSLSLQLNS